MISKLINLAWKKQINRMAHLQRHCLALCDCHQHTSIPTNAWKLKAWSCISSIGRNLISLSDWKLAFLEQGHAYLFFHTSFKAITYYFPVRRQNTIFCHQVEQFLPQKYRDKVRFLCNEEKQLLFYTCKCPTDHPLRSRHLKLEVRNYATKIPPITNCWHACWSLERTYCF